MERKKGYNQFCPLAKGAEIFAERWTPLLLRELMLGSTRFSELRKGLPRMSQSLLVRRLQELEDVKLIKRRPAKNGHGWEYLLTEGGVAMRPVVEQLAMWGYQWAQKEIRKEDLDGGVLMWDMQRGVKKEQLPDARVLVHFYFPDADKNQRRFWLLLDHGEVDLCHSNPGYDVDLTIESRLLIMTRIWLGELTMTKAMRAGELQMDGPEKLRRSFPGWMGVSQFAELGRQN